MTRWRSFLAAAGIAIVAISGYIITTSTGRTIVDDAPRERLGRGRFGRDGALAAPVVPCNAAGTSTDIAVADGRECACQNLTNAFGDLIVERGSGPVYAYCTKGNMNVPMPIGGMVACTANTPRIRPLNANGTGALTVMTELKRWNYAANSEDFSSWRKLNVNSQDPTTIVDVGRNPANQLTADKVTFYATGAGDVSDIYQGVLGGTGRGCPMDGGNVSASVYIAGAPDSGTSDGTIDICTYTGTTWQCSDCAFHEYVPDGGTVSQDGGVGGWSRCEHADYAPDTSASPIGYLAFGNLSAVNGGTARARQDVYLSKAQCEHGATVSSPIDNTTGSLGVVTSGDVVSVQESCLAANARTSVVGDSLSGFWTAGPNTEVGITERWPTIYGTAVGRTVDNWALPGYTLAEAESQWAAFGEHTRANRIIIWVGINDLANALSTGHQLWTSMKTWIEARNSQGIFVTVLSLAPCGSYSGWSPTMQTYILDFNSDASTYCAAHPSTTKYVNVYTPLLGVSPALNVLYEAPDHLHINQAGLQVVADTVAAASP